MGRSIRRRSSTLLENPSSPLRARSTHPHRTAPLAKTKPTTTARTPRNAPTHANAFPPRQTFHSSSANLTHFSITRNVTPTHANAFPPRQTCHSSSANLTHLTKLETCLFFCTYPNFKNPTHNNNNNSRPKKNNSHTDSRTHTQKDTEDLPQWQDKSSGRIKG